MIEAGYHKRTADPHYIEGSFKWRVPAQLVVRKDGRIHVDLFKVCPFLYCAVRVPGKVVESSTAGYVPANRPSVVIFRKGTPMGFDYMPGKAPQGLVEWDLIEKL